MTNTLLTLGQMLETQSRVCPDRAGARDLERALSFRQWDRRANRLANALIGLGLGKGDRVAVLAYNCLEWAEIYAAAAKAGLIVVPINFRLAAPEAGFIIADCGARAVIAQDGLHQLLEQLREGPGLDAGQLIHFGCATPAGWRGYEDLLERAADAAPGVAVTDTDPWTLMYTSGTTGNPKGVLRSHRVAALLSLSTQVELGLSRAEDALLVMPMCHANSLNFFGAFSYCGGAVTIYSRPSFDPGHAVDVMASSGATFTSLVPTHYIMMLGLGREDRQGRDLGRMRKLMISSAPARADTKRQVMEMFPNSGLFELYGSSECGWVTMLHPDEQFTHLGTVGRECVGCGPVKILDEHGNELPDGEPGELYSCTPYTFETYWNRPDKTAEAFRGDWCTVGDMALRDADGFIKLIDRKKNMIISGGENIYPSEVESALGSHEAVRDVAVIGLPDDKWGERVHAVVVLHPDRQTTEAALIDWCKGRIAGFKRPRSVAFIAEEEMPYTATGKVLHRVLRDRYAKDKPR